MIVSSLSRSTNDRMLVSFSPIAWRSAGVACKPLGILETTLYQDQHRGTVWIRSTQFYWLVWDSEDLLPLCRLL